VAASILVSLGASAEEAELTADTLVTAEIRGVPTHGAYLLPMIADRVEHGLLVLPTAAEVISDDGAVTHVDGGNGLGQVAASLAMSKAVEKASRFGIGATLVRNTNNIGLLAYYSMKAAEAGMIGFCMTNGAACMAPTGGREAFLGTNPLSIAAPWREDCPVVLDMSTSVAARGKIRRAARQHESIPPDWALDESGLPTTDPVAALDGTLLPIGGPKGYGMAFFVDLISGLLSGSSYSRDVKTFHKPDGATGVGMTAVAIDISRFMPADTFAGLVQEHASTIRGSKTAQEGGRIYLPGEIESDRAAAAREDGVELDEPIRAALENLIEARGLDVRLDQDTEMPGAGN
jgi:LDH2 family malate/lactate/ureidoglycolate dehydrogenase